MKTYTIIAGINGVGKSSLTGALKSERRDLGSIIDVDMIAVNNKIDNLSAGKIAINKIDDFLEKGMSFTQETTLSGHFVEKIIRKAKELNYSVRLYYIGLNTMDESLLRIRNRVLKGGHDIAAADVKRRYENRFESFVKVLPYCDEVKIFENDNGFINVADFVNGELIYKSNVHPNWLTDLQNHIEVSLNKKGAATVTKNSVIKS
ncbi:MAG: hypothetical protein RR504_00895 [Christensenellaceae bacterium]